MSPSERIYRDFERRIRNGELAPGAAIPFEQELAQLYGCARATANKALARLAAEGLIERRRKAGSFVARPKLRSAMLAVPDIRTLIESRGEPYAWRLLARDVAPRPPESEAGEGDWLALSGLHIGGGRPFGHEARWINLAAVPGAASVDFAAEPPGSWLLRHVPWTNARHRVRAVRAEPQIAAALGLDRAAPCLSIERWTWRVGEPVTYARLTFPGDRYDLEEEFNPRSS